MKKKLITTTALTCALLMTASLTACGGGDGGQGDDATLQSYVSLNINPAIELTLDSDDNVLSVYGANEDGEILLYGETESLIGVSLETAVDTITELAEELGYFDENSVVNTTVTSDSEQKEEQLVEKITAKVTSKGNALGLNLKVNEEQAFSIMRQYKEYLEEHELTEADLPIKDFKLALSASETGDITIEAAIELDKDELISMIFSGHERAKEFGTRALREEYDDNQSEMDKLDVSAVSAEYIAYFLSKLDFNSLYNSLEYSVYSTYYHGLKIVSDAIAKLEDVRRYALDEQTVQEIMTVLDISDVQIIQDRNGNVTIASVERYADKVIKNLVDEQTAQALTNELTSKLNLAEENLKAFIDQAVAEYAPNIQQIISEVNAVIQGLEQVLVAYDGTLFTDVSDVNSRLATAIENGLDSKILADYAEEMKAKADLSYEKIQQAISNAGEQLQDRVDSARERIQPHKDNFEQEMNSKRQQTHERINEIKEDFRGNAHGGR